MARQENRKPRIYHGVFASHPDNDTRLHEVVKEAHKINVTEQRPDNRDVYLGHVDGLAVGSSRAQGVVRGSRFYHGDLGITMAFPSGWVVDNQPSKVVAYPQAKDAMIDVSAQPPPQNVAPKEFLGKLLQGTPTTSAQELDVNGLPGYLATARSIGLPWGNQGPAMIAVVYFNNLAYVFKGAPRQAAGLSSFEPLFVSSVKTFRRLKDNEFQAAEPDHVKVIVAGQGTTVEQLAKASPIKQYATERLRLLNDLYPDKEPTAGQKLKIVQ
jgi:predicted Zn-dependent protease